MGVVGEFSALAVFRDVLHDARWESGLEEEDENAS